MRKNCDRQPSLSAIAEHVHLSEYHFQRLFTRWAGISPKRFMQFLTLEYAKSQIAQTKNLLDLSLDAGLSSPGRLHDLFVNLEAITPGEYKAGGTGLQIRYGIYETPFGFILIATTTRGICNLHFLEETEEAVAVQCLHQQWGKAELVRDQSKTQGLCDRIFPNPATVSTHAIQEPLTVVVKGTNFVGLRDAGVNARVVLKVTLDGSERVNLRAANAGAGTHGRRAEFVRSQVLAGHDNGIDRLGCATQLRVHACRLGKLQIDAFTLFSQPIFSDGNGVRSADTQATR